MPTQMNNAYFEGHIPRADAACVRAMREGGGIMLGKTVTTEFAIGRSGPTVNPHNPAHTPGGSSSGAGAGTAAGMFCAGFGTQTQGSIVRPASFNGVVGFKPTLGALSTDGVHPLSRSHDHLGVLGQSVDTVWALARWVGEIAPCQDSDGLGGMVGAPLGARRPTRLADIHGAAVFLGPQGGGGYTSTRGWIEAAAGFVAGEGYQKIKGTCETGLQACHCA